MMIKWLYDGAIERFGRDDTKIGEVARFLFF